MRVAAKELTSLILDEDRLRNERSDRKLWKSRISNLDEGIPGIAGGSEPARRPDRRERRNRPNDEEDTEYRLAIEASKHEAEEEKRRRENAGGGARVEDDDDLAKAIRLSKEEEELRRRELEESNAASLFDDTPVQPTPAQPTGYNQGYQQQGAVDWFGNPVDQQQPMSTGFLNNQYSQPTGFPQQQTGYVNGFQPTGFDQSQFQPQQQNNFLQPQPSIQPQQTSFNNPYANDIFGQQQQQQQPQQESFPQAGSHNPWASNQQQSQEPLKPAQTGSNNPFARNQFQTQKQQSGPPSLSTLAEQKTATQFSNTNSNPQLSSNNPIANFQAPRQPASTPPESQLQQQHAHLNALLASGDGQDTFGNTGDLRIPAQHTAPGTFVNSAGQGLQASQTGNNPFFTQQFTGAAAQHPGMARPTTGQPNNNPFGAQQQQPVYAQQPQQGGGSLIDL